MTLKHLSDVTFFLIPILKNASPKISKYNTKRKYDTKRKYNTRNKNKTRRKYNTRRK